MQSLTLSDIRDTLTEFLGSIGDEGDAAEAERERNRVKRMLTALGFEGPLETATTVETAKPAAAVLEDASQSEHHSFFSSTIEKVSNGGQGHQRHHCRKFGWATSTSACLFALLLQGIVSNLKTELPLRQGAVVVLEGKECTFRLEWP